MTAIPSDPYEGTVANLCLDDLKEKEPVDIKLSLMTSTCYRYSQLERSLECLARQTWKDFEVLICADGEPVDLFPIYHKFEPFLHLKTIRREKTEWSVDPTGGFKELMPLCEGEYWAIMQPEMLLYPNVCELLYMGHQLYLESATYVKNAIDVIDDELEAIVLSGSGNWEWVSIKPYFLDMQATRKLDRLDWHKNLDLAKTCDGHHGFGNISNTDWGKALAFPWWFVGSAHKNCPIWGDMPVFRGHAMIDLYLYGYRKHFNFIDIVPKAQLAIHQDHVRIAHGVGGEWDGFTKFPVPQEWK